MARKKVKAKKTKAPLKWHATPLKGSFMAIAIVGFLISAYLIYASYPNLAIALMIVFAAMFIASLISMTKAPLPKEEL